MELSRIVYYSEPPDDGARSSALVHGVTRSSGVVGSFGRLVGVMRGRVLVVYGRHDVEFLRVEAARRGIELGKVCYVDVLSWVLSVPSARDEAVKRGRFTLDDALAVLMGVEVPRRSFHDPVSDAIHVALLFMHLAERLGNPPVKCYSGRASSKLRRALARLLRLRWRVLVAGLSPYTLVEF